MVYTISVVDNNVEKKVERAAKEWKGLVLSFIASLPFFTHGLESTELYAASHAGHFVVSPEAIPLNATALVLAAAVSAPIYCCIIDRYGRKTGIFIVSLMQGTSCIPLFLSPNQINTIALHAIAGVASGGLFTVLPSYVCEISSPSTRGLALCLMMPMMTAGYLMKLVMSMEVMMYVLTAMVLVQFLSMLCLVESPSYLVKRGKFEIAREHLSRLKCLGDDSSILTKEFDKLKEESERAKLHGNLDIVNILRNVIWRDATKIGVILHTTMVLCGSILFLDKDKALQQLKMDFDPDKILVLGAMCAGSLVTLVLVTFVERKILLTFGYVTMVLSTGVLAIFTQMDLTVTSQRWLPVAALGVLVFGHGMAWCLPNVVAVEIFNFEIRATMIGALYSYAQILNLIQIHTIKYIEDYVGIYTLFYIYAAINLYGAVYALFVVPNFKNKSNRNIEKQLKRIPLF